MNGPSGLLERKLLADVMSKLWHTIRHDKLRNLTSCVDLVAQSQIESPHTFIELSELVRTFGIKFEMCVFEFRSFYDGDELLQLGLKRANVFDA